ncbi:MAG: class I SAM-dependent methyltransferase [Polyangiaceae bacterium]|nr:class I SAM-dependent methyltransferase [Polyangiaceae bacterium]
MTIATAPSASPALETLVRRDREVWEACAPSYEDRIVHGHPDVQAYLGFEDDLIDRLLIYLVRDCGRRVRLHDVGCGSGRLHLRYGRQLAFGGEERTEPALAAGLESISGVDFSSRMLDLARRKLVAAGLEPLLGSRLQLEEGSAFDLPALGADPLPVVVTLCNTLGVMQGPTGAGRLFAALRRAVGAGGIALVSCYQREAVEGYALGNYESTLDVSGQPRWLTPASFATSAYRQVPRHYKRAYDPSPGIEVDVFDRSGRLVQGGHVLTRDAKLTRDAIRTGHIRTHSDYESRWYSFRRLDSWIAEHWSGMQTHHVRGAALDALRGGPAQVAFLDGSGLLAGLLRRHGHTRGGGRRCRRVG